MIEAHLSIRTLLDHLTSKELIDEAQELNIDQHLAGESQPAGTPWYIQALLGVGAWVAAIFFLIFMAEAKLIRFHSESLLLFWGVAFIIGATLLRRFTRNTFPVQLALALSAAGHIMFLFGVAETSGSFVSVPFSSLIVGAILYFLYSDNIHRFLSGLLVTTTFTIWVLINSEIHHGLHLLIFLEIAACGILFLTYHKAELKRPLAWSMALSVPVTLFLVLVPQKDLHTVWWPSTVILAAALLFLYGWLYRTSGKSTNEPLFIASAATLILGAFTTPGLLAGIGLIVLGYAVFDRLLVSMGLAFLPAFIIVYYYEMDVPLMHKSWILMGSGLLLLAVCLILRTRPWFRRESS